MDGSSHARQQHGMDFEKWLMSEIFTFYVPTGYTDKWDATNVVINGESHGYVSIKTCKYGSPIGFGDAIRQYENSSDFLLIVGFWRRAGAFKKFVSVKAVKISARDWHTLFEEKVKPHELKKDSLDSETTMDDKIFGLDRIIKTTESYKDARTLAKAAKKELPSIDIVLNPKIDSKNQRRLQCSLPFAVFWEKFAKELPFPSEDCTFLGKKVPSLK